MTITLMHFVALATFLFFLGILGFCLNRRNLLMILLSLELILLGANIALVGFGRFSGTLEGEIFTLFILGVAAVEAAIGLALIMLFFRQNRSILLTYMERLKG